MTHISDGEIIAMADREKLWQVVYNITDNAIKYTQSGGKVEVGVFDDGKNCRS
jgi:signal transduction histidine kinase